MRCTCTNTQTAARVCNPHISRGKALLLFYSQNYAKKLVNADRASLFLVDTNTNELYARIFDTGRVDENLPSKEIR